MVRQALNRLAMLGLAAIGLHGCMTASTPAERGSEQAICNAAAAQAYVGQRADQVVGTAIVKASGARALRWGPPNAAWTMDYREDRVNVRYDDAVQIIEITCG